MLPVELAPDLQQALVGREERLRIMAQPARLIVVDVRELRQPGHRFQELVNLLLVLDDRELDLRILEHERHLLRGRVLIERNRHATQRLHGGERPVEARAVVADDCEIHTAFEALRGKPASQRTHLVQHLRPSPGLPDAEVLFADCRAIATGLCVMREQAREGVELLRHVNLSGANARVGVARGADCNRASRSPPRRCATPPRRDHHPSATRHPSSGRGRSVSRCKTRVRSCGRDSRPRPSRRAAAPAGTSGP